MRKRCTRFYQSAAIVCLCLLLCHCGGFTAGRIDLDSKADLTPAEKILLSLLAENDSVQSLKGSGRVKLTQDNQTASLRAAWMGVAPDRIRIEVRTSTGQPVASLSSDGQRIYIFSYLEDRLYRTKASEGALKRIISVEMSTEDFLDLLRGRVPIHRDGDVRMEESDGEGALLVVDGRGRGYTDCVFLEAGGNGVRAFERRDKSGRLIFRATFDHDLETDGHYMPRSIVLSNDDGVALDIRVDRCWVNPEVDENKFVLESS